MRFFTYQVLNVARGVQVLMVEVLGPAGVPIQRTVYLRKPSGRTEVLTRGFSHWVEEYAYAPLRTPDGHTMRMPARFGWRIEDDRGREVISVEGKANDDFVYGLGAGYAGSYGYTGRLHGKSISGTGYIEWIDRR